MIFEFRTGDIVICKKSLSNMFDKYYFIKGEKYELIYVNYRNTKEIVVLYSIKPHAFYSLDPEEFEKYFYSKKELRKIKLDEIKNNQM